jgi:hypothetical protein
MIGILGTIQSLPMTAKQFQQTQTELTHQNLLNYVPIGCPYEDALAEFLSLAHLGVVLDKHTSRSRTTWLAGSVKGQALLVVLDSVNTDNIDRASIDFWTNIEGISDDILLGIQKSQMGVVPDTYRSLDITWYIEVQEESPSLIVILSASKEITASNSGEIYFIVEYQDSLSETFKTTYPLHQEQVSIAIELGKKKSVWTGSLDDSFLTLFLSDSAWKSIDQFHQVRFTWRDALIRQIERKLKTGKRLTSFIEVAESINLQDTPDARNAKDLFFTFCLDLVVEGCKNQRVSDHCRRCVILSGLVICFNPKRGLSGYLEMVLEGPEELSHLGSERTWRDHLSGIVNSAQDFKPMQVELKTKKKSRGPGRPPTQLLPTIPPLKLFRYYTNNPETIVCKYCRFSKAND